MTDRTLRIPSTHLALRSIGPWLTDLLNSSPEDAAMVKGKIELAVHELASNSVDHAKSSNLELHGVISQNTLTIVMTDAGLPYDEQDRVAPIEPQVRGYGLMIIEQVATGIEYQRRDHLNEWTLHFSLVS